MLRSISSSISSSIYSQNKSSTHNSVHILVSIFIHILLAILLSEKSLEEKEINSPIEIEIVPSEARSSTVSQAKMTGKYSVSKNALPKLVTPAQVQAQTHAQALAQKHARPGELQRFAPILRFGREAQINGDSQDSSSNNPHSPWGSGSANLQLIEDFLPLEKIRIQTDSLTFYPTLLAAHSISGTINARLSLTPTGCNWQHTKIWGHDRHLRIYTLSILKKLCRLNDLRSYVNHSAKNVDFSFGFILTEDSTRRNTSSLRGNIIYIDRFVNKSKMEVHFGPFMGVFPIPYVTLDFQWLQENWERHMEGNEPFDTFVKEYSQ